MARAYALAGPDDGRVACPDRGALEHGPPMHAIAGLAHRRLSIIDLSDASAQPMVDEQGRVAVAYNGELYNYVELRRELEARGHRFRSSGDTEILLRGWLEWGPGCVEHFRGMWAFAVLDLSSRRLVLARDRFGIKPLFWTHTGGVLRFASEIKGLLAAMPTPDPDEATVGAFLLAAADTGRQTFFEGIERLGAGRAAHARPRRARLACRAIGSCRTPPSPWPKPPSASPSCSTRACGCTPAATSRSGPA